MGCTRGTHGQLCPVAIPGTSVQAAGEHPRAGTHPASIGARGSERAAQGSGGVPTPAGISETWGHGTYDYTGQ